MKTRNLFLAVVVIVTFCRAKAQVGPECPVRPTTLEAMRACYRPVLIFAASSRETSFAAQQALLEQHPSDMLDRSLLYVPLLAQAGFNTPPGAPYAVFNQAEVAALRSRFGIRATEFAVVLIGKDGGEKFRSSRPVSVLKLDALVDAMPMGREEKNARSGRH